ncbi:hypothetical protein ASG99_10025 [Bacillus sp. Soil768D1]|nr:hypothetical protein ASG99_10025 [Bacillus sp. Soil768D1]
MYQLYILKSHLYIKKINQLSGDKKNSIIEIIKSNEPEFLILKFEFVVYKVYLYERESRYKFFQ